MKKLLITSLLFVLFILHATASASGPGIKLLDVWAYGEIVTDSVVLPFEKNNLRFYCAPVENIPADSVEYNFMLEGYNAQWFVPFKEGWFFYTELPSGDYVFHARCRYRGGDWGPEITHSFTIICPWWRTWWAYTIYIIVCLSVTFYIVYLIRERVRLSNRLRVENELKKFRSEFVIQASREFRTPLTIIRSVIEKLTGTHEDHLTRTDVQHLRNSSKLLMQMVEDLMEYRHIGAEISPASINDVIELADIPINSHRVLVVEHDVQLADIIRRELLKYVKVQTHDSGEGIIEKINEMEPHVVILDTEISGVNAYDLISDIRRISKAIIILISDFDNKRSLIRAIRSEADDFLPKPFNCEVLSAMVIKRIKINEQYKADSAKGQEGTCEDNPKKEVLIEKRTDKLFLQSLDSHISAHLSDSDFDVNALAEAMHLSRGQLGRKVKALRGVTPVEYIRDFRLRHAASLIQRGDLSVQEVMQRCGMTDPANFYRRFKDKYGMPPTAYRESCDD